MLLCMQKVFVCSNAVHYWLHKPVPPSTELGVTPNTVRCGPPNQQTNDKTDEKKSGAREIV